MSHLNGAQTQNGDYWEMGAGTYLTTALTAVQGQTEESKQTVEGEGRHPVSFPGTISPILWWHRGSLWVLPGARWEFTESLGSEIIDNGNVGREERRQYVFKARLSGECVLVGIFCHTQLVPLKAVAFLFGRLNKLERFHSSVLQELSNLEENLQVLKRLEEDALASSLFVLSLGRKRTFSSKKEAPSV